MTQQRILLPSDAHPITITPTVRRAIVRVGTVVVADTTDALTLSEASYPAVQYVPRKDVEMDLLERSTHTTYCPYKGNAHYFSVPALGGKAANAVWTYESPHEAVKAIEGHLAFYADRFAITVG